MITIFHSRQLLSRMQVAEYVSVVRTHAITVGNMPKLGKWATLCLRDPLDSVIIKMGVKLPPTEG